MYGYGIYCRTHYCVLSRPVLSSRCLDQLALQRKMLLYLKNANLILHHHHSVFLIALHETTAQKEGKRRTESTRESLSLYFPRSLSPPSLLTILLYLSSHFFSSSLSLSLPSLSSSPLSAPLPLTTLQLYAARITVQDGTVHCSLGHRCSRRLLVILPSLLISIPTKKKSDQMRLDQMR